MTTTATPPPAPRSSGPLSIESVLRALGNIGLKNLEDAADSWMNPRSLVLDGHDEKSMASETVFHVLNVADTANRGEPALPTHTGLPQIEDDVAAHDRLEKMIRVSGIRELADAVVIGEEASQPMWRAARALTSGYVIVLDPIDGSSLFDTVGSGHSTNILLYNKFGSGDDKYQLLLAIVVSGRHTLAWMYPNRVFIRANRGMFREIDEPVSANPRSGYVSTVAAMPHHRAKIGPLLGTDEDPEVGFAAYRSGDIEYTNPAPTVLTNGGAPVSIGLAIGRLSAMAITAPQTLHDAAELPALLALNLPIYGAHGRLDSQDLMQRFNILSGPGTGTAYTPIPPFVIGRDERFVEKLSKELLSSDGGGNGNVVIFPGGRR